MRDGQGWHLEPQRHALAARGIKTGMSARGQPRKRSLEPDVVKVTNPYDNKDLRKEITGLLDKFMDEPEDLGDPDNPDTYSLFVHTIAAGHQGIHQPGIVADLFGIKIPADAETPGGHPTTDWDEWEWAWEEIEDKADKIAEMINSKIDLPGTVYFGSLESYGDYGLYYMWDKGDHKAWDKAVKKRLKENPLAFDYWIDEGRIMSMDDPLQPGRVL